ncbi:hypothetical protein [Sphaerothrix gracilis]|uniref:hypothetical protein n=1 Tax=Sphaerothrix gracilis TaxID=3151835 RepID=UPI0031FCFF1F
MQPESIGMVIGGSLVTMGGEPARLGINPITINPYFCRHNSNLFDSFAIGLGKGAKAICKATKTKLQK